MAKPRKPKVRLVTSKQTAAQRKQAERDVDKLMESLRPAGELSAAEQYRRSTSTTAKQDKLDKELPWRHSYANWCMHVGVAAAKYNARIDYGPDTYDAWESGISPDAYARDRGRK